MAAQIRQGLFDARPALCNRLFGPIKCKRIEMPEPGRKHDMGRFAGEPSPGDLVLHDVE